MKKYYINDKKVSEKKFYKNLKNAIDCYVNEKYEAKYYGISKSDEKNALLEKWTYSLEHGENVELYNNTYYLD